MNRKDVKDSYEECFLEEEVAKKIQCSTGTLSNNRSLGRGLPYIKIGRSVRYLKSDVLCI